MKVYNLVKLLPAFLLSYPVVCIYYNRYISVGLLSIVKP
jgi:hypothetical protein